MWLDIAIKQDRRPGLRARRRTKMTDSVVDVPPIRNGFGDALAQQGLKPASETVHGGFDRAFQRLEAGGHGFESLNWCALSQQARFELVELGCASLSGPLRAKVGEQAVDDRQCPAPLEERFGSAVIDMLYQVQALSVLERDHLPATAALLRPFTCRPVGQVVFTMPEANARNRPRST